MNEDESIKRMKTLGKVHKKAFDKGFQKGKLQAEQDFLKWLKWLWETTDDTEREQIKVKIEQIEREINGK